MNCAAREGGAQPTRRFHRRRERSGAPASVALEHKKARHCRASFGGELVAIDPVTRRSGRTSAEPYPPREVWQPLNSAPRNKSLAHGETLGVFGASGRFFAPPPLPHRRIFVGAARRGRERRLRRHPVRLRVHRKVFRFSRLDAMASQAQPERDFCEANGSRACWVAHFTARR